MKTLLKFIFLFCVCLSSSVFAGTSASVPSNRWNNKFKCPKTNKKIEFKSDIKFGRIIYVDSKRGDDSNSGLSEKLALKNLSALNQFGIKSGDEILLKGGNVYFGTIKLKNIRNSKNEYIHIGSYGKKKATIDCKGYNAGVWIENTSNVIVSDLKITGNGGPDNDDFMYQSESENDGNRYGIKIQSSSDIIGIMHDISVQNVDIYDVFYRNPVSFENRQFCDKWGLHYKHWSYGIQCYVDGTSLGMNNILIDKVNVTNVSYMGIQAKGHGAYDGSINKNVNNFHVVNSTIFQSGGPGMQFSRCTNSDMRYCHITESGNRNDNRKWGRGSGMWTWGCYNFLLEHNIFEGAQGIGDSCGVHIDFNCTNVVIQYCLSRYNCGGFIEVLGLNNNCCYRYNVSIDDGWKDSRDVPSQAFWGDIGGKGVIVSVNGHNSTSNYIGPYNTYVYNNTIVNTIEGNKPYTNPFRFGLATSNRGLLVMNNIFWFAKKTELQGAAHGWKDGAICDKAFDFKVSIGPKEGAVADKNGIQNAVSREMNAQEYKAMRLVMKNNLYKLYNPNGTDKFSKVENALPKGYWDENALGGNPDFKNVKGSQAEDMIPSNSKVIMRGMNIPKLNTDDSDYGIYYGGLKVTKDFFGREIKGNILGAIMPKK